jgi:hypothetical protein
VKPDQQLIGGAVLNGYVVYLTLCRQAGKPTC